MNFVARIVVEVEAETFAVAADHERGIKDAYRALKETYPDCKLEIKQLRNARRPSEPSDRVKIVGHAGKVSHYAE